MIHKPGASLLITGSNFQLSTRAWIKFPRIMTKIGPCSLKCNNCRCNRWHWCQFEIYFAVNEKWPWLNLRQSVPLKENTFEEWYKKNKSWFLAWELTQVASSADRSHKHKHETTVWIISTLLHTKKTWIYGCRLEFSLLFRGGLLSVDGCGPHLIQSSCSLWQLSCQKPTRFI